MPIAKAVFGRIMPEANQIKRKRQDVHVTSADLLKMPEGTITEAGLRQNINVGIAATAEISRAQVWQQIRHKATFTANGKTGTPVTKGLCRKVIADELAATKKTVGAQRFKSGRYKEAAKLFRDLIEAKKFPEFLTLPAYDWIVKNEKKLAA